MPGTLPCPNPACSHVFSPQEVRGAASLTCPKCGHVFRFAAGRAATTPRKPAPPVKAPKPRPTPPEPPVLVPVAPPVAAEEEPEVFVPPPEPRRSRPSSRSPAGHGKRRRGPWRWLIPVALVIVLTGLGVAGWLLRGHLGDGPAEARVPDVVSPAMNYSFRYPGAPWEQDNAVERTLGASFAMRRRDPNSWFAFVAHDFKDRMPRDDEMLHEAIARLTKLFKKGAEWELRDEDTFLDQRAQRLVFTAENSNTIAVSGECLMTAYNGIGYWFFGWTPSAADPSVLADVQQEWATIRRGFTLLKEREGWTGKVPEMVEVAGKTAGYRLTYTKDLWQYDDSAPDADLLLHGRDPLRPQDAQKWAWLRVFVRPPAADADEALKEARAYVEEREKKLYPETKVDPAPETARSGLADGPLELGQAHGQLMRLRVTKAEGYQHFFALVAVPRPNLTLVIVGECAWPQREAWQDHFGPVLQSLHFDKK